VASVQRLADRQMQAKATTEIERARMLVIRRKRIEGRICDVDEASRFFGSLMVEARDTLLTIPSARASDGADTLGCDPAALEAWLEEVIRTALGAVTSAALGKSDGFRRDRAASGDQD
jgi:hypothetical protein